MALFLLEKMSFIQPSVTNRMNWTHKHTQITVILSCCFIYTIYYMCGVTKKVRNCAGSHWMIVKCTWITEIIFHENHPDQSRQKYRNVITFTFTHFSLIKNKIIFFKKPQMLIYWGGADTVTIRLSYIFLHKNRNQMSTFTNCMCKTTSHFPQKLISCCLLKAFCLAFGLLIKGKSRTKSSGTNKTFLIWMFWLFLKIFKLSKQNQDFKNT